MRRSAWLVLLALLASLACLPSCAAPNPSSPTAPAVDAPAESSTRVVELDGGPLDPLADRAAKATRTEEVAVMLDTKFPLKPCEAVSRTELNDYWRSWQK